MLVSFEDVKRKFKEEQICAGGETAPVAIARSRHVARSQQRVKIEIKSHIQKHRDP